MQKLLITTKLLMTKYINEIFTTHTIKGNNSQSHGVPNHC